MRCNKIFYILCILLVASACKKQTVPEGKPINITVFNGLDNGSKIYGFYSDTLPSTFALSQQISNGGYANSSFIESNIRARYFISPDTLPKDIAVFDENFTVEEGKAYSLYIVGDRPNVDHFLVRNDFQRHNQGDSTTYVQIVNASNDLPITVNLKGQPNGSFVDNIPYKNATAYLPIRADMSSSAYEFEFRDANTGDLLHTELVTEINGSLDSPNKFLYKNWTMVFSGHRLGADVNALKVRKVFYEIR